MIYFLMLMIAMFIRAELVTTGHKFIGNLFLSIYITIVTVWIYNYYNALSNL